MKLGPEAMEALRAEVGGKLMPGDDLVVAGAVALAGTTALVKKEYAFLRKYFSENFLWEAGRAEKLYSAGPVPEAYQQDKEDKRQLSSGPAGGETFAVHCQFQMGEGGVLAALWKTAEASGVGLRIDLRKIPIRQETIEICERLDVNPYKLTSEGSVLIAVPEANGLLQYYRRQGVPAAMIGQAVTGNDRLLYSGEIVRYLDRPDRI